MRKQKGNGLFELLVWVAAFVGALFVVSLLDSILCTAKWKKSGMPVSWGPMQGCLVQTKDGRWIPEDRYREVP